MILKVLYLHPIGAFGGASRSLCELIRGFPENTVAPYIITQRGSVEPEMIASGAQVISAKGIAKFDNTLYGYYRGIRWLLLLREVYYIPFTLAAIYKARNILRNIDLIHLNEPTALPAMLLAKLFSRSPVVIHVRSLHRSEAHTFRDRLLSWALSKQAAAVIAIDQNVLRSLPSGIRCHVIHNSFTAHVGLADEKRPRFGDASGSVPHLRVGLVGNFLALKGVREFAEAALICKNLDLPVNFLLVGSNPRMIRGFKAQMLKWLGFADDVQQWVNNFIRANRLESHIHLTGFTKHVADVYRQIDVLCFPSYYNAVGRPVFEAAFWQVPSIAAVSNPESDTLVHGQTGLAIESSNPELIVSAIKHFVSNPTEVRRMGKNAQHLAMRNFNPQRNAAAVLAVYREILQDDIRRKH